MRMCVSVCPHEPELAMCCVLLVGRLAGDLFGDRELNGPETVSVFPCLGDFSGFLRRGFPGGHNSETLACWQLVIQNASVAPRKRLLPPRARSGTQAACIRPCRLSALSLTLFTRSWRSHSPSPCLVRRHHHCLRGPFSLFLFRSPLRSFLLSTSSLTLPPPTLLDGRPSQTTGVLTFLQGPSRHTV